jgi:hypothetical protein
VASAIDEPLMMALIMVLEGVEPYTPRVWLEPIDELDERGALLSFDIGDILDRVRRASRET